MTEFDSARWRAIDELLDRVLDAPESERAGILDEACAGDEALRRDVEKMLDACEKAGGRFDEPPLLVAREVLRQPDETEHDAIGERIGPWRIVELLGRGGMGAVYRAERDDGAFRKTVALKIVKRGMDTDEIIRRFHQERQILARLEHTNIAGLIDGGVTGDGMPYFVMELAVGEPIDEWCDARTLLLRERLQLFRTVCEAVQYAHGNLIVHRDLKPANIVVSNGEVKLLDFGIAKLLGPEETPNIITQAREARLTPRYAAPEQVRGEATTTATDVYSLGIVLFELLTGRPPYRLSGRTLLEMEVVICNEDPMRPSVAVTRVREGGPAQEIAKKRGIGRPETLQQIVRGDLDAICLKALRKAPEERYVSAVALADDIERYLDGRPVRAVPPSRGYRIRKFVQRNYAAVLVASITGLMLVLSTIITLVSAAAVREQSRLREQEYERANGTRDYLISMLSGLDPDVLRGRDTFTPRQLVEIGVQHLDSLENQPELRANVMNALGRVAYNLSLDELADSLFGAALEIVNAARNPNDAAVSLTGLAEVIRRRDLAYDSVQTLLRRALEVRRAQLPADDPRIAESKSALAFALYNEGTPESVAEAVRLFNEILSQGNLPPLTRADALERLADVLAGRNELERAIDYYELAIATRVQADGADNVANARAKWGLSRSLTSIGETERAEQVARESVATLRQFYKRSHRDIAWAEYYLGLALSARGEHGQASAAFRESAAVSEQVNVPGYVYTARAYLRVAQSEVRRDSLTAANLAARSALAAFLENADTTAADVAQGLAETRQLLGRIFVSTGRFGDAVPLLQQAYEGWLRIEHPDRPDTVAAAELADAYDRLARHDSARSIRQRIVSARGN